MDDEDDICAFIQATLEERGYRVLRTRDPQQALRIAAQESAHLLLTDVVMPLMTGTELARRLQAFSSSTRVLLMSAYVLSEATASGYACLAKPFTADTLADRVQHALDQPSTFARPRLQAGPSDG